MQIFINAAKKRQEVLDHVLFFGAPGLGKTTLSFIITRQMQANMKATAGPMIEKSGDLVAMLTNLEAGDILFIDEIHRLNPQIEEILYPAMEDFKVDIIIGSGPAAQSIKIDLQPFTLIGATTRAGMLSNPLRDRFGMHFRMQLYTEEQLQIIITQAALKLNKPCLQNAALEIAKRSRGTPRIALRLLKRVRDFADVNNEEQINIATAQLALNALGVNDRGLDELDLTLLNLLITNTKPLGLATIAAFLGEDEGTVEDVIEPFLIYKGYLQRTAKGRVITDLARQILAAQT